MRGHFISLLPAPSRSTSQTAHSAVVCLSFPAAENHVLFFSVNQSPEACHQHSFENDLKGPHSHAHCLFDCSKSQAHLFLATVLLPGLSLSFPLCSCDHPTQWATLFARRLFDCPSQEDSSLSFIWLNYHSGFAEGEGMSDTSLNDPASFPSASSTVCLPAYPSLKGNLLPSTVAPTTPQSTTAWVLTGNRPLTDIKRAIKHLCARDTRADPGERWHSKTVAYDTLWCLNTLTQWHTTVGANSSLQSHIIIETLIQQHNKRYRFVSSCIYMHGAHAQSQVSNYMSARQTWHILASLKHTQTHTPRHHLQSKGRKSQEWVLSPHTKTWQEHSHTHIHINNKALMYF